MTDKPTDSKLKQVQAETDVVLNIVRDNVEKVLERDVKLLDIEEKSEALSESAFIFQRNSRKLKNQMWWKDKRRFS